MSELAQPLLRPNEFYHYVSVVQTMMDQDPVALGMGMKLPVNAMRAYVRRYHRERVVLDTGPAGDQLRASYERSLAANFVGSAATGYLFGLN